MRGNERGNYSLGDRGVDLHLVPKFIRVGRPEGPQPYVKPEHPHEEYEWILIRKGRLRFWIDGVPLEAAIALSIPRLWHRD